MEEIKCDICSKTFIDERSLKRHYKMVHGKTFQSTPDMLIRRFWAGGKNSMLGEKSGMSYEVCSGFIRRVYPFESRDERHIPNVQKFYSFYKMITTVRDFDVTKDFDLFFDKVLPWKIKHPKMGNNKELCSVIFDNKEQADELYKKYMLAKNPYYGNHDTTRSPFSKNYVGYQGMTDEEKEEHISKITKRGSKDRTSTQIGYWLKRGLTEEEARKNISERQKTFTLEKCIKKYGEELGRKRWEERQKKWQETMNNKLIEEIERINRAKMWGSKSYSNISQELFWKLYDKISDLFVKIYFAQLSKDKNKDDSGYNNEYFFKTNNRSYFVDFCVLDNKKIIEFDGYYWHEKSGFRSDDKERDEFFKSKGFDVLRVKENDYYSDEMGTIRKCLNFLTK